MSSALSSSNTSAAQLQVHSTTPWARTASLLQTERRDDRTARQSALRILPASCGTHAMKSKLQAVPIPLATQGRSEEAQFVIRERIGPVGSGKTIMMENQSCKAIQDASDLKPWSTSSDTQGECSPKWTWPRQQRAKPSDSVRNAFDKKAAFSS